MKQWRSKVITNNQTYANAYSIMPLFLCGYAADE